MIQTAIDIDGKLYFTLGLSPDHLKQLNNGKTISLIFDEVGNGNGNGIELFLYAEKVDLEEENEFTL